MMETTCSSLLAELQKIWDEIGEDDAERDRMLYDLEQECLVAYKRKVDQANRDRAQLRQAVAEAEAQLAGICAALGENQGYPKKISGTLKKELQAITPHLEVMKKKREGRKAHFLEVQKQICSISKELSGSMEINVNAIFMESDLSSKRLEALQNKLTLLQKEKDERVKQVHDKIHVVKSLCLVLGMDFAKTVRDIHPTLDETSSTKSISVDTLKFLSASICRLRDVKLQRLKKLQDLAMTMVELWNLMDTPLQEQQMFQKVTVTISASENEVTEPNCLSLEFIDNAAVEVLRLQELKLSKIKEVFLKKRVILEQICQEAHMVLDDIFFTDLSLESVESGAVDVSNLLERLNLAISSAKEEASSRKEVLDKVKKWMTACDEECWLEEYNRDESRYCAGRGSHLILKRAEKARVIVNKIPGMVDMLKSKAKIWEKERNKEFLFDGDSLVSMLDRYCELKRLKEQERQRQRDQKKVQGQLIAEQEAMYGAKPTPTRSTTKNFKPSPMTIANDKRFSVGGAAIQKKLADKASASSHSLLKHKPVGRQMPQSIPEADSIPRPGSKIPPVESGRLYSDNATDSEALPQRKALSPLPFSSSNIISYNFQNQNTKPSEINENHIAKTSSVTPLKTMSNNGTQTPKKLPIPAPATPPTVSAAMQTTATPFTPAEGPQELEYSYEERRAGFSQPRLHCKPLF